jgi:hypothetical protein
MGFSHSSLFMECFRYLFHFKIWSRNIEVKTILLMMKSKRGGKGPCRDSYEILGLICGKTISGTVTKSEWFLKISRSYRSIWYQYIMSLGVSYELWSE